jgi:hypothetical protein
MGGSDVLVAAVPTTDNAPAVVVSSISIRTAKLYEAFFNLMSTPKICESMLCTELMVVNL